MSYILDALRKSDQQRQRGVAPTLRSAQFMAMAPEPRSRWPYGVLAVVLAGAAFAIGWARPWQNQPPVAGPQPVALKPLAAPAANPAPPARSFALQDPEESSPRRASRAPRAAPPRRSASQAVPATKSAPATAPASPVQTAPAMPEKPADVAPAKRDEKVPSLAELPAAVRQEIPQLSVSVHAYSRAPRDRLVAVNGKLLHEGDALTADLVLETITPHGMVFSHKGTRFHRGAQ